MFPNAATPIHGRRNVWHIFGAIYGYPASSSVLTLPRTEAQAQSDEVFVQYRQKIMASQGASMGAINDILKNKLPYQGISRPCAI